MIMIMIIQGRSGPRSALERAFLLGRRPKAATAMDMDTDIERYDRDFKKKRPRFEEPSAKRRERRQRAGMRTYARIAKAATAALVHHTQESILVQFMRDFLGKHSAQRPASPQPGESQTPKVSQQQDRGLPLVFPTAAPNQADSGRVAQQASTIHQAALPVHGDFGARGVAALQEEAAPSCAASAHEPPPVHEPPPCAASVYEHPSLQQALDSQLESILQPQQFSTRSDAPSFVPTHFGSEKTLLSSATEPHWRPSQRFPHGQR